MKFFIVRCFLTPLIVAVLIQTSFAQISQEESPALRIGTSSRYSAIATHREYQQSVHENFNRHDFKKAFEGYSLLAMFNDKVAQYRLAFMYHHGLGIDKNPLQAYAWAKLSKESQPIDQDDYQQTYVNLYEQISAQLDELQREHAELLATEYYSKYSLFAVAQRARRLIRKNKTKCTGSLLGVCDRTSRIIVGNPRNTENIGNLRNTSCDLVSNRRPGTNCLTYASVGLAGVSGLSGSELNTHLKRLDQIIERYNPGRVELHELEIIDQDTFTERS